MSEIDEDKLVDYGQEDSSDTTHTAEQLEGKYADQMRQIVTQKIDLPITTLPAMIKEQINLNPDFQRRDRWNIQKQSRFIESIIMNVPIPPVFLGENEYGNYEVLDGRQRLTAISDFMKNLYQLKGLGVWGELNGLSFNDFEKKRQDRFLTRRFVPAIVILKESSHEVKYDVFDRLNTGGVVAQPMEIRNAVYQGEFNKVIHELSGDSTFRKLWGIPQKNQELEKNETYSKMYDLELVLRFFALNEYGKMNLRFRDYLSDFMGNRNKEYKKNESLKNQDVELFNRAVQNCWKVFESNAFRPPPAKGKKPRKSAPLGDAVMIALSRIEPETINPVISKEIREKIMNLCINDDEFKQAISKGTNGKGAIKTRIEKALEVVQEYSV